ncbi:MAG: AbrB/MazE/SpoVT family DNA-binding domain-containing protein [Desulfurococcales archaeon]|nr:AbrB/MazE/SpoVT family DNA-binding domain-containing protein [Desulfurococcales archaeon]
MSGESARTFTLIPRKVQRLGASSLIVTIPKEWARRNGIKVGDVISLVDVGDRLIILPKNYLKRTIVRFDGKHKRVVMHIGRVSLCGFIFGQDRIIVDTPRQGTAREVLSRLERVMKILPYIYVRGRGKQVIIDLESPMEDPWTAFKGLGNHTVNFLEKLISLLDSNPNSGISVEELETLRVEALRNSFRLLRTVSLSDARGGLESVLGLHLFLYASLLGVAVEEFHDIGRSIVELKDRMSEDERERVKAFLQMLEVALATLSTNMDSYSVKKVEEAHWRLKSLLDVKTSVDPVIDGASPAYAYILGKLTSLASVLELAGSVMACYMVMQKYSERVEESEVGLAPQGVDSVEPR